VSGPLIPGLGEELAAAADRMHRRRRRRYQAAAAGSLAVLFAGAVLATTTFEAKPASADVRITERNGRVEVLLTDLEARPQVVEDALRDADIDADVVSVPVSPSIVGRFVNLQASAGRSDLEPLDGDITTARGFSVPEGFVGHLELTLGRPARPGEDYAVGGNALSADEPLACRSLQGHPVSELLDVAAADTDLDFLIRPIDPTGTIPPAGLPIAELASSPVAGWKIAYLQTLQPDQVLVTVTPDGQLQNGIPSPIVGC
jgi:hypothetical protein